MAIEAARLAVIVDAVTDGAERGLDHIGDRVNRSGGMIRDVASTAFGFLSAQAVMHGTAAAGSMLTLGMETQNAMNVFQSVTGSTGDTMSRVSALARELGNDITLPGTSAKDATLAMVELAKAGLSVDDTMAAAQGTLQLAAAAEVDAATAAEIAANNLNAFGLAGSEANRVADLLAAAANASSGSMSDMAAAMQMSSTVFAQGGQTIDDLTASIGLMANKGIMGSDAGTSLKTMMLALMAPTDVAAKKMRELGLNVRDADGNMRPMRDLVEEFTRVTQNMGAAERDAAMKTIFGTDAIRAANVVLAGGVEAYDAMHEAVTKQGAAGEVAAARMKGLGGAIEGLKSNIETVLIDAFMVAAPIMERVVRWAGDQLPNALSFAGRVFDEVRGAVRAFAAAFRAGDGDVTSSGMAGAFERIAFVARQVWDEVARNWPQIKRTVSDVMETVSDVIGDVVDWVAANWPKISTTIRQVLDTVRTIISGALEGIAAFWRTWGGTITDLVTSAFDAIRQIINGAMQVIRGVIDVVMGLLRGDWSRAWDGLRAIVAGVWDAINGVVDAAIDALRLAIEVGMRLVAGVFDNAWALITSGVAAAWDAIVELFSAVGERLVDALGDVGSTIWNALTAGFDFLRSMFAQAIDAWVLLHVEFPRRAVEAIGDLGPTIWNAIVGGMTTAATNVATWVTERVTDLGNIGARAVEAIGDLGATIWNAIVGGLETTASNVASWVTARVTDLGTLPGRAVEAIGDLGGRIWSGISSGLSQVWVNLVGSIGSWVDLFEEFPGRVANAIQGFGERAWGVLKDGWNFVARNWNDLIGGRGFSVPDIPGLPGRGSRIEVPRLPVLHTGGIVPGTGDVMAILQGGEAVFTRDQMRELGRVIGAGGVGAGAGGRGTTIVVQNTFRIGEVKDRATANHLAAQVADFQRRVLIRPQVAIAARGAR